MKLDRQSEHRTETGSSGRGHAQSIRQFAARCGRIDWKERVLTPRASHTGLSTVGHAAGVRFDNHVELYVVIFLSEWPIIRVAILDK